MRLKFISATAAPAVKANTLVRHKVRIIKDLPVKTDPAPMATLCNGRVTPA
jgi:hypothetical protein